MSMLVYKTKSQVKEHPEAPVFYIHQSGEDLYQIIVQKMPKQEQAVA